MNIPLSQAGCLFEKYTSAQAVSLLQSLPTLKPQTFENDWLDFKTGYVQEKDLGKIWSTAIGGFANNEGGVLVWGLHCDKDPTTGVDAVTAVELVPNVFKLKSRLVELRRDATDPPVADIELRELPISGTSMEGFVVCHIPESKFKPHRSEIGGKNGGKHFYMRIGDECREMSVSLLRQLFFPNRNPRLQVELKRLPVPPTLFASKHNRPLVNLIRTVMQIGVRNIGEISVVDLFVGVKCEGHEMLVYNWDEVGSQFYTKPVASRELLPLTGTTHPGMQRTINLAVANDEPRGSEPFEITVFANDMQPRKAIIPFVEKVDETLSAECLPVV